MIVFHKSNIYTIRKYQEIDRTDFVSIFTNEELCKFMAGGAYDLDLDAEKLFENFINKEFITGIFHETVLIGHLEIIDNSFTNENEKEIVFILLKNFWGKGIMNKIISKYNKLFIEKFVARVKFNNYNSIKMLSKIGISKQTIVNFNNEKVFKVVLKK